MGISIITPHYNDFRGLKQIHDCLLKQDSNDWEWIIVDDCSSISTKESLTSYFEDYSSSDIKLILNKTKSNGSVCRNIGITHSKYTSLVFLDSDDIISEDFVRNRLIEVLDFVVFKNFNLLDQNGDTKLAHSVDANYLDYFLQAKFIWQTTCVLWHKEFLIKIGKFNINLERLQDVELSIRALFLSNNYRVINNKVDFFYCVAPINIKNRPIDIICESVNYLITFLDENYQLNGRQKKLVTGYYFLCVRYFSRLEKKDNVTAIQNSLKLFHQKKYMSNFSYLQGLTFLKLYKLSLISRDFFLRLNRYFYK